MIHCNRSEASMWLFSSDHLWFVSPFLFFFFIVGLICLWWYIVVVWKPPCGLKCFCLTTTDCRAKIWYQYNALNPPPPAPVAWAAVRSKAVVLLLLICCLLLLPLWGSVFVLCFVIHCFVPRLVLQSSWWGWESGLLCIVCLPGVLWLLYGSSLRCLGLVCSVPFSYFLIILTCFVACWVVFHA